MKSEVITNDLVTEDALSSSSLAELDHILYLTQLHSLFEWVTAYIHWKVVVLSDKS